jgi:hypothetical protein
LVHIIVRTKTLFETLIENFSVGNQSSIFLTAIPCAKEMVGCYAFEVSKQNGG